MRAKMRGDRRPMKGGDGRNRNFNPNNKRDARNKLLRDDRVKNPDRKDIFSTKLRRSLSGSRHTKGPRPGAFDDFDIPRSRFSPPVKGRLEGRRSRSPLNFDKRPFKRSRSRGRELDLKFSPPAYFDKGGRSLDPGFGDRPFKRSRSRGFEEGPLLTKFSPPRGPPFEDDFGRQEKKSFYDDRRPFSPRFRDENYPRETILKDREVVLEENYHRNERGYSAERPVYYREDQEPIKEPFERPEVGIEGKSKYPPQSTAWDVPTLQSLEEKTQSIDTVPEFNPETSKISAKRWIKLIETLADKNKWEVDEKRYHMTSKLAGFARQWYLNTGKNITRWQELRTRFIQSFPSEMDYCTHLTNMLNRKKREEETMVMYFEHKVALLNMCDITGAKAVSCIIGGLTDEKLRREARSEDFNNVDNLLEFLRSREVEEKEKMKKFLPTPNNTCSYCRKVGHFEAECKIKAEDEAVSRSSNKVVFGALADNPTYPQYFKEVSINGSYVRGYVDLASECITIREEFAIKLRLSFQRMYKVVRGFGGSPVSCIGEVDAIFGVDKATARAKAFIVPDHIQAIPVVIGQSFTKLPNISITGEGDNFHISSRPTNEQTSYYGSSSMQPPYYY